MIFSYLDALYENQFLVELFHIIRRVFVSCLKFFSLFHLFDCWINEVFLFVLSSSLHLFSKPNPTASNDQDALS
jgi:hypothetical protein